MESDEKESELKVIEIPYFFENNNYSLFGILHKPATGEPDEGFIFCHPFAEEKLWTQRVYVNFARELAKLGFAVLRFDFMGHGDSEGDFHTSSISTRVSDIKAAFKSLKEKIPSVNKINLLGLRFGATLAVLASKEISKINNLILWDPIIDGLKYMQEMLRINLTTQTAVYKEIRYTREDLVKQLENGKTVNVDGYEIANVLYQEAIKINLLKDLPVYAGKSLIVQISSGENARTKKEMEALAETYMDSLLLLANEFPFWKEIKLYYSKAPDLFNKTLEWLNNNEK